MTPAGNMRDFVYEHCHFCFAIPACLSKELLIRNNNKEYLSSSYTRATKDVVYRKC